MCVYVCGTSVSVMCVCESSVSVCVRVFCLLRLWLHSNAACIVFESESVSALLALLHSRYLN